jgi:hypothetical protein
MAALASLSVSQREELYNGKTVAAQSAIDNKRLSEAELRATKRKVEHDNREEARRVVRKQALGMELTAREYEELYGDHWTKEDEDSQQASQ